ncbi:hypothetical protein V6N13_048862 [Hibiscus sabdariffa]
MENLKQALYPTSVQSDEARDRKSARDLFIGSRGGRPSENVVSMNGYPVLERPGSPVSMEFQPVSKKGRNLEESMEFLMQSETVAVKVDTLSAGAPGDSFEVGKGKPSGGSRDDVGVVSEMMGVGNKESQRRLFDAKSEPTRKGIRNGKEVHKVGLSKSGVQGKRTEVDAQGSVLEGKTTLNLEKHVVVEVVDMEHVPPARGTKGQCCLCQSKGNLLGFD